ncbi:hypothetical protein JB92DRAFT_3133236 [Gautieria morchelliformis]|nr:hypothetical protein JB92DRAFT_3133236 [Gautieria morchelliformis]
MSDIQDAQEPTVEELDAELKCEEREAEKKREQLKEKCRLAQERKDAVDKKRKEDEARKVKEAEEEREQQHKAEVVEEEHKAREAEEEARKAQEAEEEARKAWEAKEEVQKAWEAEEEAECLDDMIKEFRERQASVSQEIRIPSPELVVLDSAAVKAWILMSMQAREWSQVKTKPMAMGAKKQKVTEEESEEEEEFSCDNCDRRKVPCIRGTNMAFRDCNVPKVHCSFTEGKWKRRVGAGTEVPAARTPRPTPVKPMGVKPVVKSRSSDPHQHIPVSSVPFLPTKTHILHQTADTSPSPNESDPWSGTMASPLNPFHSYRYNKPHTIIRTSIRRSHTSVLPSVEIKAGPLGLGSGKGSGLPTKAGRPKLMGLSGDQASAAIRELLAQQNALFERMHDTLQGILEFVERTHRQNSHLSKRVQWWTGAAEEARVWGSGSGVDWEGFGFVGGSGLGSGDKGKEKEDKEGERVGTDTGLGSENGGGADNMRNGGSDAESGNDDGMDADGDVTMRED